MWHLFFVVAGESSSMCGKWSSSTVAGNDELMAVVEWWTSCARLPYTDPIHHCALCIVLSVMSGVQQGHVGVLSVDTHTHKPVQHAHCPISRGILRHCDFAGRSLNEMGGINELVTVTVVPHTNHLHTGHWSWSTHIMQETMVAWTLFGHIGVHSAKILILTRLLLR